MDLSRDSIQKIVDAVSAVVFGLVCLSGGVLHHASDATSRALGITMSPLSEAFLGLTNGRWTTIHDASSFLLVLLLATNLYWGWSWFAALAGKGPRQGSIARPILGVVALFTAGSWFLGPREIRMDDELAPPLQVVPLLGPESDARIRKLSLDELEKRTRVPSDFVRSRLGLPADVPRDVPLAELMKTHHFSAEDVRRVLILNQGATEAPAAPTQRR